MGKGSINATYGKTEIKLDQIEWEDKNNNGVPEEGEVKNKEKDQFVKGDELACYKTIVNKTKPKTSSSIIKVTSDSQNPAKKLGENNWSAIKSELKKFADSNGISQLRITLNIESAGPMFEDLLVGTLNISGKTLSGDEISRELIGRAFSNSVVGENLLEKAKKLNPAK